MKTTTVSKTESIINYIKENAIDEQTAIARRIHDEWMICHHDKLGIAYVSTKGVPCETIVTVPLDVGMAPLTVSFFSEQTAREWCKDCGLTVA